MVTATNVCSGFLERPFGTFSREEFDAGFWRQRFRAFALVEGVGTEANPVPHFRPGLAFPHASRIPSPALLVANPFASFALCAFPVAGGRWLLGIGCWLRRAFINLTATRTVVDKDWLITRIRARRRRSGKIAASFGSASLDICIALFR